MNSKNTVIMSPVFEIIFGIFILSAVFYKSYYEFNIGIALLLVFLFFSTYIIFKKLIKYMVDKRGMDERQAILKLAPPFIIIFFILSQIVFATDIYIEAFEIVNRLLLN